MSIADHFWMLAATLLLDAAIGDPDFLWRRIPHPVALAGKAVGWADSLLNRPSFPDGLRRALGIFTVIVLVAGAAAIGVGLDRLFYGTVAGHAVEIAIVAILLAGRSLYDHVRTVATAFATGGLEAARLAVSRIVGRDPASLDQPRLCRAAIESAAENFSDGVVAPALWYLVLGLPGILAYKAINTADSMIGHLTPRHSAFGWAAARLDDLVNWPAARLAGALIALAAPLGGGAIGPAFRTMREEAPKHRSPNAGWPEAAMAGGLDLALAGPRRYGGIIVDDPYLNPAGRRDAAPDDIGRALRVYLGAWGALFLAVLIIAAGIWLLAVQRS